MSSGHGLDVAAVVVTFNRLALLQRLVSRLRTLEAVDAILVVDNASSDGTGEWLFDHGMSLPSGSALSDSQVDRILEVIAGVVARA